MGRANCTRRRRRRRDGNVARGGRLRRPRRNNTLSSSNIVYEDPLSLSSTQYSPLSTSRCDVTLLEKYAYERIAREGEQARTQSVHTLSDCTEGRARRRCGVPIKLDLLRVRGGREYRVDRTAANPREPRNIRRPQFLSSRPRKPSAAIFSGEMPIDAHAPDTLHNIGKGDSDTSIHA